MDKELIGLWRFDESPGPIAWNSLPGCSAMEVRGAVRQNGRFGSALCFRKPGDNAVASGLEPTPNGTVSCCFRLDCPNPSGPVLTIHDQVRLGTDRETGSRLVAFAGEKQIVAADVLELGKWTHVAVTFGSMGVTLYLDGQCKASDSASFEGVTRFVITHLLYV